MRQLTASAGSDWAIRLRWMVVGGAVALAVAGWRRPVRERRPVVVVNAGAIGLWGGTVTVTGDASGNRAGEGWQR
jgi:hypothetical protein